MVSAVPPGRPSRGLRGAIRALGGAALGLLQTRLELAAVELDDVRERAIERLVFVLIAVLGASALVVVAFWESNRLAALSIVILFYVAIGLFALWRLAARSRTERPPFAETIAQFERDRVWLSGKAGEGE